MDKISTPARENLQNKTLKEEVCNFKKLRALSDPKFSC
jgi:hypothetical protein